MQNARLACLVRQAALVLRRQEAARPRREVVAHSSEDLRVGEEFFQRYRHARCRDGGSGRDGTLMDVIGTTVYLRGRDGLEFVCRVHDLVIVAAPPPGLHRRVRYIGAGEAGPRPDGVLTELWAVDQGKLAIVQPPARHAWFALLSELESVGLTLGPVADWAEPPFVSDSAGRRPPRR
ncbi:hypothetical protein [Embleya scabrispora]|uniref:hypothetical protein n=1 Tax=Embleya scabrispora TaxID=159449 RepID=UPI001F32C5D3|nr:hypothetical protein [Embleya scabrispora]